MVSLECEIQWQLTKQPQVSPVNASISRTNKSVVLGNCYKGNDKVLQKKQHKVVIAMDDLVCMCGDGVTDLLNFLCDSKFLLDATRSAVLACFSWHTIQPLVDL